MEVVNQRQDEAEMERLRQSVNRGARVGQEAWVRRMVRELGLEATQRRRGRPRKRGDEARNRDFEAVIAS